MESMQEKNRKKNENEPRADRFGDIVPAGHADNRLPRRRPPKGQKGGRRAGALRRRTKRNPWPKRGLFFLSGLVLCYAALIYLVVPAVVQGPLARQAGQLLGGRLTVGMFSLSPVTFRFRAEDVVLSPEKTAGGEKPWLKTAAVTGRLSLFPLLQGRVEIGELVLQQPAAFLQRDASGRYIP